MKFSTYLVVLFSAAAMSIPILQAQVTIGSHHPPIKGALLDLKQNDDGSSSKGFGLPRVRLMHFMGDLAESMGVATGTYTGDHTGMVVYNAVEFDGGCPGLYVWDGIRWVEINEPEPAQETHNTVFDRDGNEYRTHLFGPAGRWMVENLRTTTTICGTPIPEHADADFEEMLYVYPKMDGAYSVGKPAYWKPEYGLLYNWRAATHKKNLSDKDQGYGSVDEEPVGRQGLCPKGWHLPSDREWSRLEQELVENAHLYSSLTGSTWNSSWNTTNGARDGGDVMKSPIVVSNSPLSSTGGSSNTNGTGLNIYLTGLGTLYTIREYGKESFFWTSSYSDSKHAWCRFAYQSMTYANRSQSPTTTFMSVRCKKS
ncbi:FISUMP domain-containing protein [Dysgonomonas sp. 25]|uniref:FISUMP domain-containing protein n=1 Tax=Dysgonomonas sp. 25 TaxID=2302933 RepID=UPI0013D531C7|nr:FISUMP domain-containing protein [Dysgonomonas sp. 25]NDV68905.1 hypothetical protein [Dysgonomonas sp. 25]